MIFKAGDLVYCRHLNIFGYLKKRKINYCSIYPIEEYPFALNHDIYTKYGQSNIENPTIHLTKICETYLTRRLFWNLRN